MIDILAAGDETMSDLGNRVFVFTGETFERALEDWVQQQIAAFPHKEELILITALAMRDFLAGEEVRRHKMEVSRARPDAAG
jgi:hypothetical protein